MIIVKLIIINIMWWKIPSTRTPSDACNYCFSVQAFLPIKLSKMILVQYYERSSMQSICWRKTVRHHPLRIVCKKLINEFNYALLFMGYYIYTSNLNNKSIFRSDFITKFLLKYKVKDSNEIQEISQTPKLIKTIIIIII